MHVITGDVRDKQGELKLLQLLLSVLSDTQNTLKKTLYGNTCGISTDIHQRYQEPAPSWSQHGAQIGGLWVFPIIKIVVVHQVYILPACTAVWEWSETRVKCHLAREDCEGIWFLFSLACVGSKNWKTTKLNPMADDTIKRGGIGLGSPVYICGNFPLCRK